MRRRGYYCAQACPHLWHRILVSLSLSLLVCAMLALPALAKIPGKVHCYRGVCHRVMTIAETERLIGSARTITTTYYDDPGVDRFNRGEFTSSGERFDANNPGRAASSNFPDGTELLIWNPLNGRAGHVRINDFGPFHTNRTLDVTRALGEHLGMTRPGVVALRVIVIAAPHRGEPRYRRNRTFQGAKGYLGTYDEDALTRLASELIAEAQRARLARQWDGSNTAKIPIPLQKLVAHSELQVATAALPTSQRGGDAQFRRLPGDKSDVQVDDPRPTVSDSLLSPPATRARASEPAQVAQGPTVAAWTGRNDTSAASFSGSTIVSATVWGVLMGSTYGANVPAAPSFVIMLSLLVMTALSLLLLNGKATFATQRAAPLFPMMKRVLRPDFDAPLRLSKRAQSALKALLPSEAPNPLIEPGRIEAHASFIGRELRIAGHLTTRSDVILEGHIEGDCACSRIVIKASGNVRGDLLAEEVVVHGTVEGKIQAKNVRLENTARATGEVSYCDLSIQSGAFMEAAFRYESSLSTRLNSPA